MAVDLPHRSAILGAAHSSCVLATCLYGDHNDLPQERKKANQNPRTSLSKLSFSSWGKKIVFEACLCLIVPSILWNLASSHHIVVKK